MRHLTLGVLALSLFLAACAQADPPAPVEVPNTPEAVAQAFMKSLGGLVDFRGRATERELEPLVISPQSEARRGVWEPAVEITMMVVALQSMCGARTLPQPAVEGDRATVDFQPPPMHVVLVQVDGQWKVDLQATMKALPESFQKLAAELMAARARAEQVTCLRNLKQLGLAVAMYATDHNNVLPDADHWTEDLEPYFLNREILRCPSAPKLQIGYAMNRAFSGRRQDEIPQPWAQVLFFESDLGVANASGGPEDVCRPGRHYGGNNFLFLDGHAKWYRGEGFPKLQDLNPPPTPAPGAGGPPPGD